MRYFIRLSYDGSQFSGWQKQTQATTVQGQIQEALSILTGTGIEVTGAGRTDAGVNAINYILHFDAETLPMEARVLVCKLNAILPPSIAVHELAEAPSSEESEWHARYSAKNRQYHYFIHFRKDPFVEKFSWRRTRPLDLDKMNEACEYLLGTKDFSCFEKTGGNNSTSICTLSYAKWETYTPDHARLMGWECSENDYIYFTVRANRFLRNMVRAIVGSMVEIGLGKHGPEWIGELIEGKDRGAAGESVPGHALFLSEIDY